MSIGSARKKLGMTQEGLACQIGVDRSSVAKWETGVAFPKTSILVKIADILGCTVDELLRSEEEK